MCGIVGYIGESQAAPILLDGLSKLEYRGYDSAGIAVYDGENIKVLCQGFRGLGIPVGRPMGRLLIRMRILIITKQKQLQ